MAEVIWTSVALDDLGNIAEYIAISTVAAAKDLVERVFSKIERLELQPESGKVSLELSSLDYREVIVNPCRVFYKIENDKVFVLHVMRQERDLIKFLLSS